MRQCVLFDRPRESRKYPMRSQYLNGGGALTTAGDENSIYQVLDEDNMETIID